MSVSACSWAGPGRIILGLVLVCVLLPGEEREQALPTEPPRQSQLQYPQDESSTSDTLVETDRGTLDLRQLSADVAAMSRAAERIRAALRQNKIEGYEDLMTGPEARAIEQVEEQADGLLRRPEGEPRVSSRLGSNDLAVQRFSDGSFEVDARIGNERVKQVYGELLTLLNYKWNDQEVANPNQRIDANLVAVDWRQALTRILGQSGLGWQERGGDTPEVLIFDINRKPATDRARLERLAGQALNRAAAERDNEIAAQALYLRAERELTLGRYRAAVVGFLDLINTFAAQASDNPAIRRWMHRSFYGLAESFSATKQYHEARTQYVTYISLADDDDPRLAEVYLKAADASRLLGRKTGDIGAYVKAMELLDHLVHKFGSDPQATAVVTRAHNMLGVIYFVREEYRAAKEQFMRYHETSSDTIGHQLLFYLGECDFELAADKRAAYRHDAADINLGSALTYYKEIVDDYARNDKDPLVDDFLYRDAYYKVGLCHLYKKEPDFVSGLFAFLEARRSFPDSAIEGQILVHIAHCYAELESDEQSISVLYELLKQEDIENGEMALADLLGGIQSNLGDYPSPIRAKVLFYIAQAHYRAAARSRLERERYKKAADTYGRVILEGEPDPELAVAARLGRARALIAYGDEEPGERALIELLRSPRLAARDREFAAQLLGRLYQERGDLRKAIMAYRGEVTE